MKSMFVALPFFSTGFSHQQVAVCERYPPLQTDGRKVGSHFLDDWKMSFLVRAHMKQLWTAVNRRNVIADTMLTSGRPSLPATRRWTLLWLNSRGWVQGSVIQYRYLKCSMFRKRDHHCHKNACNCTGKVFRSIFNTVNWKPPYSLSSWNKYTWTKHQAMAKITQNVPKGDQPNFWGYLFHPQSCGKWLKHKTSHFGEFCT